MTDVTYLIQVGHACLGLYREMKSNFEKYSHGLNEWEFFNG